MTTSSHLGGGATIGLLFHEQARARPDHVAIECGSRRLTFRVLEERVNRLARWLTSAGVRRGDRVAILSENRIEYIELALAAADVGAVLGCQNWRMAEAEQRHCLSLLSPKAIFVSPRFIEQLAATAYAAEFTVVLGDDYEARLAGSTVAPVPPQAMSEDILTAIYTSGTTGLPKAAALSHRAILARAMVQRIDHPCADDDNFIAWAPMFHISSSDAILMTLLRGAKAIMMDGFDSEVFAHHVSREKIGHLMVMPGVVGRIIDEFSRRNIVTRARYAGITADLIEPKQLAELTKVLQTPYCNSFGSTETGWPPFSKALIPIGVVPGRLSKLQSSCCSVRLVDSEGRDVADGMPGEVLFCGPTMFSGYLGVGANETFVDERWYPMGDVFVRSSDATYDFVDRAKYLIKSGGENIYPAEIERVLISSARIVDAVVVRRRDARWGEIPVAFVIRRDPGLTEDEAIDLCRGQIAGYKLPKSVVFLDPGERLRGDNGKPDRTRFERMLSM